MIDQDDNFYLIGLSILVISLLCDVWMLVGETACTSLLGVNGLNFALCNLLEYGMYDHHTC